MQSNILNIENWSSYKDEVGTNYTYKINNHYTYELYIIIIILNIIKIALIVVYFIFQLIK